MKCSVNVIIPKNISSMEYVANDMSFKPKRFNDIIALWEEHPSINNSNISAATV